MPPEYDDEGREIRSIIVRRDQDYHECWYIVSFVGDEPRMITRCSLVWGVAQSKPPSALVKELITTAREKL